MAGSDRGRVAHDPEPIVAGVRVFDPACYR
jgi:hypothetical protein